MTDVSATAAVEDLMLTPKHHSLQLHGYSNCKATYRSEIDDMINQAILEAWARRDHIENFQGYVWGALTRIAWHWNEDQSKVTSQLSDSEEYLPASGIFNESSKRFNEEQELSESLDLVECCLLSLRKHNPAMAVHFDDLNSREFSPGIDRSVFNSDSKMRANMRAIRSSIATRNSKRHQPQGKNQ